MVSGDGGEPRRPRVATNFFATQHSNQCAAAEAAKQVALDKKRETAGKRKATEREQFAPATLQKHKASQDWDTADETTEVVVPVKEVDTETDAYYQRALEENARQRHKHTETKILIDGQHDAMWDVYESAYNLAELIRDVMPEDILQFQLEVVRFSAAELDKLEEKKRQISEQSSDLMKTMEGLQRARTALLNRLNAPSDPSTSTGRRGVGGSA